MPSLGEALSSLFRIFVYRLLLCFVAAVGSAGFASAESVVETALRASEPVTPSLVASHYAKHEADPDAFWADMTTLGPALRELGSAEDVALLLQGLPEYWSLSNIARVHVRHSYDLMSFAAFQLAFEFLEQRAEAYQRWAPVAVVDIEAKANLLHIYGQLLVRKNQIAQALGYFYEAEAMFHALDENHPSIFTIKVILGEAFLAARRYDEAADYLQQAQDIFPETRLDGRSYVAALHLKSHLLAKELEQAKEAADNYLANPVDPREDYFLVFLLAYLELLRQTEQYPDYAEYLQQTRTLAEKIGNEDYLLEVNAHLGYWYLIQQQFNEAISVLENVTRGETDIRNHVYLDAYLWLVEAYNAVGLFEEALSTQSEYLKLLQQEFTEINQKSIEEVSASFRLAAAKADRKNAQLELGLAEEKQMRAQLTTWILIMVVIGLMFILAAAIFILLLLRRKTQALDKIAWVDPLTGVGNRLLMVQEAQKKLPNFVALIDIDYLKYYNDEFGHARGDELLVFFAHTLQAKTSMLPFVAHVYRIGGDEFVVTAEQGNPNNFESCISDIGQSIQKAGFHKAGLSYGIAQGCEFVDFSEALSKADARMYQMKSNRKNHR